MTKYTKSFQYGDHTVTLETGEIARQATASIVASMSDTVVLVTAVGRKEADPGRDFFPLTINYQEKTYAAGKIPGGFFKREGRPSEAETLTCRLIDRPLRPLFPKGFTNEVQIIATVMSLDPEVDPDIVALLGSSAALAISGMPFMGPIGAARVGYADGNYLLNPTRSALESSDLDPEQLELEGMLAEVKPHAEQRVQERLLLDAIGAHQELRLDESMFEQFLARAAAEQQTTSLALRQRLSENGQMEALRADMLRQQTLRHLLGEDEPDTDAEDAA